MAPDVEVPESRVVGSPADIPEGNIAELFFDAVDAFGKPDALKFKKSGAWHSLSHQQVDRDVRRLALGLASLGIYRGDRVAILSENRPEWLLTDFACVMIGAVTVPLYPMLPPEQLEYMLRDSEARAAFVSTHEQLAKIRELKPDLPALERVFMYEPPPAGATDVAPLNDLMARGGAEADARAGDELRARALETDPHEVLTVIYTSGTTGRPKGVMLTHNNLVSNMRAAVSVLPISSDDVSLSVLPLCHIFERLAGHYVMFARGVTICYATSFSELGNNLVEVRPTIMTLVPRAYEKMFERVQAAAAEGGRVKHWIVERAVDVAVAYGRRRGAGRRPGPILAAERALMDRAVYAKLRRRTGGRARFFVSGGAPLSKEIAEFFYGAGLTILEGYGLTETSPVISANTPRSLRFGSVGKPLPGVEVAIAEDGEILTRGPHVMKGYYRQPEETAAAIDPDGWFHTGDIGRIDADGFLYVTDRKKELLKTSGGKYVAPQPIENRVLDNPYVRQAVLVGDRRKFPALLVVPEFKRLEQWARSEGIDMQSVEDLTRDRRVNEFMERQVLAPLDDLARFERPKKVGLLPAELTIEGGELTPTLKVKRRVVQERYRKLIDSLYAEA